MKLFLCGLAAIASSGAMAWDLKTTATTDPTFPANCAQTIAVQQPDTKTLILADVGGNAMVEFDNINDQPSCSVDQSQDVPYVSCTQATFDGQVYALGICSENSFFAQSCDPFSTTNAVIYSLRISPAELRLDVVNYGWYDGNEPRTYCIYGPDSLIPNSNHR